MKHTMYCCPLINKVVSREKRGQDSNDEWRKLRPTTQAGEQEPRRAAEGAASRRIKTSPLLVVDGRRRRAWGSGESA
jgi:hypothetical protein